MWRTLDMLLMNCKINLIWRWSENCIIVTFAGPGRFAITDNKPYFSVVTLSTLGNRKLLQQVKAGLIRIVNWNKYTSHAKEKNQNRYLNWFKFPRC